MLKNSPLRNSIKLILITCCVLLPFILKANVIVVDSLNNANTGSLRAAINSANIGDTIRFNPNLIIGGSDSIVLDSSIFINKTLVIKGLYTSVDTLFISGGGNDRVFDVNSANVLVLDSVVLLNGYVHGNTTTSVYEKGGAIRIVNTDSVFIFNSVIKKNKADLGNGIFYIGDKKYLEVRNTKIIKNVSKY